MNQLWDEGGKLFPERKLSDKSLGIKAGLQQRPALARREDTL
jgi:hypothetical protein